MPPDHRTHVRRLTLPSGRAIEIRYFGDSAPLPGQGASRTADREAQSLEVCPGCRAEHVQPIAWEEVAPGSWSVALRCPDCELHRDGVFDQASVDRFDETLERGVDVLVGDLTALAQATMHDDVERFLAALRADAVWPLDF